MGNILKLVQLDRALVKPYYKYFLLFFLVPAVVAIGYKDIIQSIIYAMCLIAMTSSYTFTIAEKNDLNRLYGLLPISKKDIVKGRYIFVVLMGMLAIVVSLCLNLITFTITKVPFSIYEVILGISVGIIVYSLFTAIQLPGLFKFGAIKGRFLTLIPLIGLFLIGNIARSVSWAEVSPDGLLSLLNSPFGMLMFAILWSVVLYGISIGVTQRIYNRMEL